MKLQDLTSVGSATLKDFALLGISTIEELAECEPRTLFLELQMLTQTSQDPCVEDVFRAAIEQARHPCLPQEQRHWPFWSKVRKERMPCQVFFNKPDLFFPQWEVAVCFCEFEEHFALIQRHPSLRQGGTWGLPGGKAEQGEPLREALGRELHEELGIDLIPSALSEVGTAWIRNPDCEYALHMFRYRFEEKPVFYINPQEITAVVWTNVEEAQHLNLIAGGHECFNRYTLDRRNAK